MKTLKLILSVVMVAMLSFQLSAQESVNYKISKKGLVRSKVAEDSTVEQLTVLKPILIFKGRYELGTESGDSRFALRNSRLGVQGDLSKQISYKFMVDFSDNGKLKERLASSPALYSFKKCQREIIADENLDL